MQKQKLKNYLEFSNGCEIQPARLSTKLNHILQNTGILIGFVKLTRLSRANKRTAKKKSGCLMFGDIKFT